MSSQASPAVLTHLQRLEAEAIHIMREVVAQAEKPVMMYSVGKDSAVMLHLAKKAFYPSPPPFPEVSGDVQAAREIGRRGGDGAARVAEPRSARAGH